jgi:hypothetical protein
MRRLSDVNWLSLSAATGIPSWVRVDGLAPVAAWLEERLEAWLDAPPSQI